MRELLAENEPSFLVEGRCCFTFLLLLFNLIMVQINIGFIIVCIPFDPSRFEMIVNIVLMLREEMVES